MESIEAKLCTGPSFLNSPRTEEKCIGNPSVTIGGAENTNPVDRGFAAWATLTASCLMGLFVWGIPMSSGVLLTAYLDNPVYGSQRRASSLLPLIGTFCTGIMYCGGIVINPSIRSVPRLRQVYTWAGIMICVASLLVASFVTNIIALIVLEGITFGIGGALVYCTLVSYMTEWFVKRRGLANGILFAADSGGGVLFPVIIPPLITRYGVAVTVRIYAIAMGAVLLPAAFFMRSRHSFDSDHRNALSQWGSARRWARNRKFWIVVGVNTVQGLAHFVPLIWLPTFGTALGLSEGQASLVLTLVYGASVPGGFAMGWLSDRYNIWVLAVPSLLLTALATFLLWGVAAASFAGFLVYGVAFGLTAGSWSSLWSGLVQQVAEEDAAAASMMFNILLFSRGIGSLVSTPISTAFRDVRLFAASAEAMPRTGYIVDDGRYSVMIIYTGACLVISAAIASLGWRIDKKLNRISSADEV